MEQFQILQIEKVFESPLNPRKTFNEKKMVELVESVKAKGILMPLLVRPARKAFTVVKEEINDLWYVMNEHNIKLGSGAETQEEAEEEAKVLNAKEGNDGRFEIAAGHRRYRAAIEVGLEEVPLIIREMNDVDFLEVLTIENLQREDIEPLEEAQGYRTLMKKTNYDITAIAAKVGKSESYIYQRIKLLELIPEAQKQLAEDKITAGHAILIARLQPEKQKEALKECLVQSWGGVREETISVRELTNWIDRNIHLDLHSASFSKSDPDLVPSAGPCTTCPKRTGFVPALFPDIKKKDTCTDPKCFNAKVEAFSERWLQTKVEDSDRPPVLLSSNYDSRMKKVPDDPKKPVPSQLYHKIENKKDRCESVQEGIVVDGRERGQIQQICVDPLCKKHHGRGTSYPEDNKWKAEQKARQEKEKLQETTRLRVIDAILPKVKDLDVQDFNFLAMELFDELWDEHRKKLLARRDIKPLKIQYGFDQMTPMRKHIESCSMVDVGRLLMEMALIRHRNPPHWTDKRKPDPLIETAKRYKVDVKKIEVELKAEEKEKAREKAKKKAPKKAKAVKSASVKQKSKRADPPKAKTIPMKDLCKLHAPVKPEDGKAKEMRVPADQEFLDMVEKTYSGDLLANGGNKIRAPFEWEGDFYVCLGGVGTGTGQGWSEEEAWKVMPADLFEGKTYSYDGLMAKWDHNEKERGNEHGRRVLLKNKNYVLEGPKIVFYDPNLEKLEVTPGVCQECGCTETTPCLDPVTNEPCAWTDKTQTLCTACQRMEKTEEAQRQVQTSAKKKK